MTLTEYRLSLKWSMAELSRQSGVTHQTISRIEQGEAAYDYTLVSIVDALSKALGKAITIDDLEGVKIVGKKYG